MASGYTDFAMNDDQHLMELCPFSLGLFLYEAYVPENNLIRAKNQKENITLGFRGKQVPNCYEKMQVHQQEKWIRSRVLMKNSDIANEIARKFVFKFKTL